MKRRAFFLCIAWISEPKGAVWNIRRICRVQLIGLLQVCVVEGAGFCCCACYSCGLCSSDPLSASSLSLCDMLVLSNLCLFLFLRCCHFCEGSRSMWLVLGTLQSREYWESLFDEDWHCLRFIRTATHRLSHENLSWIRSYCCMSICQSCVQTFFPGFAWFYLFLFALSNPAVRVALCVGTSLHSALWSECRIWLSLHCHRFFL